MSDGSPREPMAVQHDGVLTCVTYTYNALLRYIGSISVYYFNGLWLINHRTNPIKPVKICKIIIIIIQLLYYISLWKNRMFSICAYSTKTYSRHGILKFVDKTWPNIL